MMLGYEATEARQPLLPNMPPGVRNFWVPDRIPGNRNFGARCEAGEDASSTGNQDGTRDCIMERSTAYLPGHREILLSWSARHRRGALTGTPFAIPASNWGDTTQQPNS